jgi:hypothetical protein
LVSSFLYVESGRLCPYKYLSFKPYHFSKMCLILQKNVLSYTSMHPITPVSNVASHSYLPPLMEALKINNNMHPKNSLPIDSNGSIQDTAEKRNKDVVYDSYGKITIIPKKILIGRA